jgi:hypothetical protein
LPHITIEYMIMVPIMIAQIILFPYLAITIRDSWVNNNVELELDEICGHLGSSIQQLYYSMNHASISSGSLTAKLSTPSLIGDGYGNFYNYTITFQNATNSYNDVKIMKIVLDIKGRNGDASTIVTLGPNADWPNNCTYVSSSLSSIIATKTPASISLGFGVA